VKLIDLGWHDRWAALLAAVEIPALIPGRVTRAERGLVTVVTEAGEVSATLAGSLHTDGEPGPAAVGDWVGIDFSGGGEVVRVILPRTGALSRRRPGGGEREQVAAANVDQVLVVESVERGPNPRRIERAVALAYDGGASPAVILTKIDLCEDLEAAEQKARGGAPFCDVHLISAVEGTGLEEVASRLHAGSTSVLLGPSGVGKSTLTNALLGEERFAVSGVREGDYKGRHTTTHRELVVLPSGACLIDTPGIRELGLWLDSEAVGAAFPEIEELALDCRFGDCRHETEPGCAVLEAVEDGGLDPARLDSYLRLRREAENLDLRRDTTRQYEIRARERSFGKMVKEAVKYKKDR
jgi:ribosome biogenesis GTPase